MKHRIPSSRRGIIAVLAAVACLAIIGLVVFSPLALTAMGHLDANWSELSNVGQTYGAISALISSLALGGVIVSLLYQARDGRTAREQSMRTLQHQLLKMQMEDPALMNVTGAPWNLPISPDSSSIREHLYMHMWVGFWAGNYVMGEMSSEAVRVTARNELLNSQAGRAYWAAVGQRLLDTSTGKYNRFTRIFDEEYQNIMAKKIPVATPVEIISCKRRKMDLRLPALVGAALITGIASGRLSSRQFRKEL